MAFRCVVCSSENCDVSIDSEGRGEACNEAYLLRLLNVNVNDFESVKTKIKSDGPLNKQVQSDNNPLLYGIYCFNCGRRNQEICEVFVEIDKLYQKLDHIKTTIANDFKNSGQYAYAKDLQRIDESSSSLVEIVENRCQVLRHHIGKSLSLTESSANGVKSEVDTCTNVVEDEWTCLNIADVSYSDSEAEGDMNSSTLHDCLKKQYGINDLKIVLTRLSPLELAAATKRKSSSKIARIDFPKQGFQCIFADCPSKRSFRTEYDRDVHVKIVHKEVCPSSENPHSSIEVPSQPLKTQNLQLKSMLKCIFADCTSGLYFRSEQERNLHSKVSHGIDGINQQENGSTVSNSVITKKDHSQETKDKTINKRKHKKKSEKFKCIFVDCTIQQDFETKADRDLHLKTDHNVQEEPHDVVNSKSIGEGGSDDGKVSKYPLVRIQCVVAGCKNRKYFTSHEELDIHTKRVHEGIARPYQCEICGKTYRHHKELELHVDAVHYGKFPHICHYCGKGYTSLGALNVHLPSHTQERNYRCTRCPEAFKTSGGLLYHVRKVHTGERPFQCTICGKRFISSCKLQNHIKCVHHKLKAIPCPLCDKKFPITNYLTLHLRTHRKRNEFPPDIKTNRQGVSEISGAVNDGPNTSVSAKGNVQAANMSHMNSSQPLVPSEMNNHNENEQYQANYNFSMAPAAPASRNTSISSMNDNSNERPININITPSTVHPVDLSHFHNLHGSQNPHDFTPLALGVPRLFPTFINQTHSTHREETIKEGTQRLSPHDVVSVGRTDNVQAVSNSSVIQHQYFQLMNSFDNFHKY